MGISREAKRAYDRQRYLERRDQVLAAERARAVAMSPAERDARLDYLRRYYATHRVRLAAAGRRRERAQRSARTRQQRAWRHAHPEKVRGHRQTRRARVKQAFVEHVDPSVVFQMHGGRCGVCGEFIAGAFDVDHVIPLSRGGVHSYANTQPAHPACNRSKGARLPEEDHA